MKLTGKRILVTGAGGFIGSHLVEKLLRMNCEVTAFIHYNSFNRWGWIDYFPDQLKNQIRVITGDVRDPNGIAEAMKGIDVVFHLAALIGIPFSYHSPETYVETNVKGTLNILQAARGNQVEKIVHTSTSEVYGTAQFVPISEEHPVNPQSPYAATKAAADFLALSFFRSFSSPVTVIRPFNTYGPRQSARAVIPTILTQILSGKEAIQLGSTTPTRDLNFVDDTVMGFIKGAEADCSIGEVINLGSNQEISIGDLVAKIGSLMKKEINILPSDERKRPEKSEVERLLADNQKAGKLLGWSPGVTLEEGLKTTIEWFQSESRNVSYKSNIYNI